jgi:hypothetical protein
VTGRLIAEQERYFQRSHRLTLEVWNERGFFPRFSQNLCRLVSPLL